MFFYLVIGIVGVGVGIAVAKRYHDQERLLFGGGLLAVGGILVILYGMYGSHSSQSRKYAQVVRSQQYALGFGLGQYLQQKQPGRNVGLLLCSERSLQSEAVQGLKDGLGAGAQIVVERSIECSKVTVWQTPATLVTTELLAELKSAGASIIVSFIGLPVKRIEMTDSINLEATRAFWRSPEYRALDWVLTCEPERQLIGFFEEPRLIAFVREKTQDVSGKGLPSYLKIKGTPAELFKAWFELVTKDDGG